MKNLCPNCDNVVIQAQIMQRGGNVNDRISKW